MTSLIDPTKPVAGTPTTASVRANFAAAKTEIEALQAQTAQLTGMPRQMVFAKAQSYLEPMTSTTFISQGIGATITPKEVGTKIIITATMPIFTPSANNEIRLSIFKQVNGGGYTDMATGANGLAPFLSDATNSAGTITVITSDEAAHAITDVIDYELRARSLIGAAWYNAIRANEQQTMQLTEV